MKNLIKLFDFYGTEFHWYFDNKPQYYTFHGGILSILTMFCCIAIFLIIGYEDFKKLNPISSISNSPPLGEKTIKFGEVKLYLPWRIMDYGKTFIDHRGILKPKIYYFTNKYNSKKGIMETNYRVINYSLCNETSMRYLGRDFILDSPLDRLFCIDMDDLNIGGTWNSEFVNYIRLDLNLCKNGKSYNPSDNDCTKYEELVSLFGENNNWFFELLYPTVQFQPYNKTMPVLVLYTSYYYGLSTSSNKVDRIYLQEHIFKDEQGLILNKHSNTSYWGVSYIKTDYYKVGVRDIFRYGSTSRLYSLKIYLDYGTVFYSRRYKKLYEILSEVFPIMKGIIIIFSIFSEMFNKLIVTKKINEYIIGNEMSLFHKIKMEKRQKKININKNTKLTYNLNFHNNNNFNIGSKTNNSYFSKTKDNSQIICLNRDKIEQKLFNFRKDEKIQKKKILSIVDLIKSKPSNGTNPELINSDIYNAFEKKQPKFPLYFYFFGLCLNKINTIKDSSYACISQQFDISFNFFTHVIDITSYILLYKQFESLKKYVYSGLFLKNSDNNILEDKPLNNKNDIKSY